MRVAGINFNTQNFKGVYIVKGSFEDTSKFAQELWKNKEQSGKPGIRNACRKFNLGFNIAPKQNRYDVLVVTQRDKENMDVFIDELHKNPVMKMDKEMIDTLEEFSDNPNNKKFYDLYMEKLKEETEKAKKIFGKNHINTLNAKVVLAAIKDGKFDFMTGKIKK